VHLTEDLTEQNTQKTDNHNTSQAAPVVLTATAWR